LGCFFFAGEAATDSFLMTALARSTGICE
jgi:hypothetical protein